MNLQLDKILNKVKKLSSRTVIFTTRYKFIIIGICVIVLLLLTGVVIAFQSNIKSDVVQEISDEKRSVSPTPIYTISPIKAVITITETPTLAVELTPTNTPAPTQGASQHQSQIYRRTIRGEYVAHDGSPVNYAAAKVVIKNKLTGETFTTTDKPSWSFSNVPSGNYLITVEPMPNFNTSILFCHEGETCYAEAKISGTSGDIVVKPESDLNLDVVYYIPFSSITPSP